MPPTGKNIPMPNQGKEDPVSTYQFSVEIDGLTAARFKSAKGFSHTTKAIEHREVDSNGNIYVNKTIGASSWGDITLQRGLTTDNTVWNQWRQAVLNGDYSSARKTVHIKGHDPKGGAVSHFSLSRAWISGWKGPAFDTGGGGVAFEEITITHEGITREA